MGIGTNGERPPERTPLTPDLPLALAGGRSVLAKRLREMTIYKLYATSVADADGVASLDIVAPGAIVGILFSSTTVGPAGGICSGQLEVSFSSSSGFASNDTRSSFATLTYGNNTGAANGAASIMQYVALPGVPVNAGERIFLHNLVDTAPTSVRNYVYLYVDDKSATSKVRRL